MGFRSKHWFSSLNNDEPGDLISWISYNFSEFDKILFEKTNAFEIFCFFLNYTSRYGGFDDTYCFFSNQEHFERDYEDDHGVYYIDSEDGSLDFDLVIGCRYSIDKGLLKKLVNLFPNDFCITQSSYHTYTNGHGEKRFTNLIRIKLLPKKHNILGKVSILDWLKSLLIENRYEFCSQYETLLLPNKDCLSFSFGGDYLRFWIGRKCINFSLNYFEDNIDKIADEFIKYLFESGLYYKPQLNLSIDKQGSIIAWLEFLQEKLFSYIDDYESYDIIDSSDANKSLDSDRYLQLFRNVLLSVYVSDNKLIFEIEKGDNGVESIKQISIRDFILISNVRLDYFTENLIGIINNKIKDFIDK